MVASTLAGRPPFVVFGEMQIMRIVPRAFCTHVANDATEVEFGSDSLSILFMRQTACLNIQISR